MGRSLRVRFNRTNNDDNDKDDDDHDAAAAAGVPNNADQQDVAAEHLGKCPSL